MDRDSGKGCAVTVNNVRTELDTGEAGSAKVEAGAMLEKAGYDRESYDLFVADDRGSEPLDPGATISVDESAKFHAVRRSNPYGR